MKSEFRKREGSYNNNLSKEITKANKGLNCKSGSKISVWQKQLNKLIDLLADKRVYIDPEGELHEIFDTSEISKFESNEDLEKIVRDVFNHFNETQCFEFDDCLNFLLKTIGKFSGVDRASLFLFHSDYRFISNTHEWCAEGIESRKKLLQDLPTNNFLWATRQSLNKNAIIINDVEDLPREASVEHLMLCALGIESVLAVPISIGKITIGFIEFESHKRKVNWNQGNIVLLKAAGEIIKYAMELQREAV